MRFTIRHTRFAVIVVCVISLTGLCGQLLHIMSGYVRVQERDILQEDGFNTNCSMATHFSTHPKTGSVISSKYILDMSHFGHEWRRNSMLFKVEERKQQRYLTIGIPTVRRQNSSYILDTLGSLVRYTSEEYISEIYIVIFLADFNATWNYEMANKITQRYSELVQNGSIHLIKAPREFYPNLDHLNHTYVDPESKKKWRSKQNIDYAFLWLYSKSLSKYYMQMEDDIYTVPGYLDDIKSFIATRKTEWVCIEFSELGFIGKVYPSKYLERLAKMVILFYEEQPVDVTYLHFNTLNFQPNRIIRRPTIFQHVGYHSSLEGKIQPLKDRYFDRQPKSLKGDNPPAILFTTLKITQEFPIQNAYTHTNGYFWSSAPPTIRDSIHILFNEPQSLEKVIVLSGTNEFPTDKLEHARLDACLNIKRHLGIYIKCMQVINLGSSSLNGIIVAENLDKKLNNLKVICLRISFTRNSNYWLLIQEIAVFLNKT